ncbi:MAG: alanine transaminase [Halioglobus sp.]|nr:alanine transaminase [Halioglobus sp.]
MDDQFRRIERLPPYVFNIIGDLKQKARAAGQDIIDFGMGNPDQPTPAHIVDKLVETARRGDTHRYSQSKGIPRLRKAICDWYERRYDVSLDPATEAIVTLGSKEGLAHLALATTGPGDAILVPNPSYPIHPYGFVISGADIRHVPMGADEDEFFAELDKAIQTSWPRPKMLVLNFPSNPTAQCVDLGFYERVIKIAREHSIWVVQDLAYADLCYDGYVAPSVLQVEGAREVAVEFFSMSKSYNMPGWRIGFCCGNSVLISALARMKSYLDYGMFTPIQVAAIAALDGDQSCVTQIRDMYQSRRDVLCTGLNAAGWHVTPPKATMFVWARIPEFYQALGSVEFSKKLLTEAQVAVSPGIGFGEYGEGYVRFGLIENEHRIRQAIRSIKRMIKNDGCA